MKYYDTGIVLARKKYGETSALVVIFSQSRGKHYGLVKGGMLPKLCSITQPGSFIQYSSKARLSEHLGTVNCHTQLSCYTALFFSFKYKLYFLNLVLTLLHAVTPINQVFKDLYTVTLEILNKVRIDSDVIICLQRYIKWEFLVLKFLGYGFNFQHYLTKKDMHYYISTRTGSVISNKQKVRKTIRGKLFRIPDFMLKDTFNFSYEDLERGSRITSFFIRKFYKNYVEKFFQKRMSFLNF